MKNRMNILQKSWYQLLVMMLLLTSCLEEPTSYPNTYKGNFEALWNIIDTRYCYLDYKNVNWDSIHTVYAQQVDTVQNEDQLFDVLSEMLIELKDGHVNLSSTFNRSRYWNWFLDYPANFVPELIQSERYLGRHYRISGGLEYEKIEHGTIGYVYYESFSDPLSNASISALLSYFDTCKGLIIDVRNNGGGMVTNAELLSSVFFNQTKKIGYMSHKTGDGHADFSEPKPMYANPHESLKWEKPVVVLCNRMSYSATNIFVNTMRHAPKGLIVGDKTGGGGGLPMANELPIGWSIRYSACPFYDDQMKHIEWGIDPQVKVDLAVTDVSDNFDTLIEEAIKRIKQSTSN